MKSKTDGGYRLPAVIRPDASICVTVRVPNELNHIVAFWGALEELGYWYNWERDEQKRARDVASLWRERIQEARLNTVYSDCVQGGDVVQVRQNSSQPCSLEVAYQPGNWQQFADLSLCSPSLSVNNKGEIEFGGTVVAPNAPLGVSESGFPIQPRPRVISSSNRVCTAAVNLSEILAQTQRDLCARIHMSQLEQALAAVGIFAAVVVYPPNILWAFPLVAAIATVNTFCTVFTFEDKEDLACILKDHATEENEVVLFDKLAIQNALTATNRPVFASIALILSYLDQSVINYAASLPASQVPCPCPVRDMTVWLLSRAEFADQNEADDLPRARFRESLTFDPSTGLNRIVFRNDPTAAVLGQAAIGTRIRAWNSLTQFDNTTRTKFYVNFMRLTRVSRSTGAQINAPAQLRIWPDFGASPVAVQQVGNVTISNVWAAQVNTNAGAEGFNNVDESWILEFSIRTGRNALSLRATSALGQTVNWNRY